MAEARLRRVTPGAREGEIYLGEYLLWCRKLGDREAWPDSSISPTLQEMKRRLPAAEELRRYPPPEWTGADWTRHADYCDKLAARRDALKARLQGSPLTRERRQAPKSPETNQGPILDPFQEG